MNTVFRAGMLIGVLTLLGGCYAGAAGIVLAILSLDDSSDGGTAGPPTAAFIGEPVFHPTPDRILVRFRLQNGNGGPLGARASVAQAGKDPIEAVPLPGSMPLGEVSGDRELSFLWDVSWNFRRAPFRPLPRPASSPGRSSSCPRARPSPGEGS